MPFRITIESSSGRRCFETTCDAYHIVRCRGAIKIDIPAGSVPATADAAPPGDMVEA